MISTGAAATSASCFLGRSFLFSQVSRHRILVVDVILFAVVVRAFRARASSVEDRWQGVQTRCFRLNVFASFVLVSFLFVVATMVHLHARVCQLRNHITANYHGRVMSHPYDPTQYLASIQIIHSKHRAPLIFILQERESTWLACFLIARHVDVDDFAVSNSIVSHHLNRNNV